MRMTRYLLPLALLLAALPGTAQPYGDGCHYFRNHPSAPPVPTQAERELIQQVIARSDTFDILDYDIAIDVTDYAGQQLKAAATITFKALMDGQDFIRFELWGLEVDSVTGDGGPLSFAHDGEMLRVDLPAPPPVGQEQVITVHYHGHPHRDPDWGGFYFESGYIYNLGIGLTTIPPNFGKVWYPCFDSFVERATYTYHVKSAGTYRAHCQGDFLGEVQLGGDTVVRTFRMGQPITTHLSAIAVANYADSNYVHAGAYGDVPVRLTAKPEKLTAMAGKMVDVGAAIDACEWWYGPYAWGRVGYVLTTDGALEIPTNIAYPDFMPGQPQADNRRLLTHELGHHWWGNIVTPHTQQDMWLKEGPAEYSAHLVEEWVGGPTALRNTVNDNQLRVLKTAHVQDGGFQALSPMPDPYIYGIHTYYKGASVLHNLRGYLGDSLFRQGMHDVQLLYAYQTLDAAGFRDALEASTGYDLHPFFTDQVFAPGFSVFVLQSMQAQPSGGQWTVELQLKQKLRGATLFHEAVPLDITLIGADRQRQEYREMAGGEYTTLALSCDFEPVMAVINGYDRLNQARMAHERQVVPGEGVAAAQPRVDFRLQSVQVPDTTLYRIEHIWAAPEANLGTGVDEISGTHYWIVDGVWPVGTAITARINYSAQLANSLDHDMLGTDETGVVVLYRPDPQVPWEVYPDQTVFAGPLTNGSGYVNLDALRKGQYALGKALFTGVAEEQRPGAALQAWPVPATDRLSLAGLDSTGGLVRIAVHNMGGELVLETFRRPQPGTPVVLDVSALPAGTYVVQAGGVRDGTPGRATFVVAR
ncbi:MAG TPA: M1 family aminopeptidase [Flavobacteriales bacterium]|nr:M1 family aminopeptidase [Flavobacteriales bacterium]